jgi:DNA invertase Pin-like site-specific DNA recombinase
MRLLGYGRVSLREQVEEGVSLDVQREKFALYCKLEDHVLVDVLMDEGKSGKDMKRPRLAEMRRRLLAGEADGVLVTKLDRLTRSVKDLGVILEEGPYAGRYALVSMAEKFDTATPQGRLMLNMMMAIAQFYREDLVDSIKTALAHCKAHGKHLGRVPYGWRRRWCGRCGVDGIRRCLGCGVLEPAIDEQIVILGVLSRMKEGGTLRTVAAELNDLGVPSRMGGVWAEASVWRMLRRTEDERKTA